MREGLSAGECATVGMEIGQALAALHAAGLAHGDVSPANIVVSGRRAVLVDVLAGAGVDERGTPGFAAPERAVAATGPADVFSLGRVLLSVSSDEARERVAAWAAPMTAPRALDRPSAPECARAMERCAPPLPVRVPELGVAASVRAQAREALDETLHEDSGRGWRIWRAISSYARMVAIACAALATLALLASTLGARLLSPGAGGSWPRPVSAAIFGPPPDVAAATLVQRRLDALSASDADRLLATTDPSSPARADDLALAHALGSGDLRFDGFSGTVGASAMVVSGNGEATVRVTYAVSAHVEAGPAGRGERPGVIAVSEVEIRWSPAGWRIERVQAAP